MAVIVEEAKILADTVLSYQSGKENATIQNRRRFQRLEIDF